jgi:hypothetical protein
MRLPFIPILSDPEFLAQRATGNLLFDQAGDVAIVKHGPDVNEAVGRARA